MGQKIIKLIYENVVYKNEMFSKYDEVSFKNLNYFKFFLGFQRILIKILYIHLKTQ